MGLLESGLSTVALARWMEQNGHGFENFWGREGQISMTRDRCYKSLAWVRSWVLATTTSHIAPFTAELFRSIETKCNVKLFASTNDKNVSVEAIATCWQLELVVSEIDLRMALSHCFIAYSSRKVVNHQFKIIKDTLEIELELIFFFFFFNAPFQTLLGKRLFLFSPCFYSVQSHYDKTDVDNHLQFRKNLVFADIPLSMKTGLWAKHTPDRRISESRMHM